MVERVRAFLAVFAALGIALAGCASPDAQDLQIPIPDPGPSESLIVTGSAERPAWRVGDWFGHHVYFGPSDTEGLHIDVVVVATGPEGAFLATNDAEVAKFHAVFDVPILGTFAPDLSTTGFGARWQVYQFPLEDGATWRGSVSDAAFEVEVPVEFRATFNPEIRVAGGVHPGFDVLGFTTDGVLLIETDYVPAIGWYSRFVYHDTSTEDPDDFLFHTTSMGHGKDWTGTYYVDTARELLELTSHVYPDGGGLALAPDPYRTFQVASEAHHVFGFAYSFAYGGASTLRLEDPQGTVHEFRAIGGIDQAAFDGRWVDVPAVAGEWRALALHAGVATGGGAVLWAITEEARTL